MKWFSIDRVFRNETLDATHLAEFHQVEGVVADRNLTLGDLIGVLYKFFSKMGEWGAGRGEVWWCEGEQASFTKSSKSLRVYV